MASGGDDKRRDRRCGVAAGMLAVTVTLLAASPAPHAQTPQSRPPTATAADRAAPVESGVGWQELSPPQKDFLRPLEREWRTLESSQKRKWLALSGRVPGMSADERGRIQTRMTDWAKLTPEQRGQARLRYQEAKQMPLRDRQARWDAYQSLPTEQKRQLAERASMAASASLAARRAAATRADRSPRDVPQAKSNIVSPPEFATAPRQVAPTLVQARPGTTTTSIARPPAPPPHQQAGLPKIAATPEFVNKSTLLPRRGPQSTAAQPAAAGSAPNAPAR